MDKHASAQAAMRALASHDRPETAMQTRALDGSSIPGSRRLRVGRYRILLVAFPDEKAIVFTTAFLKRRESDYDAAIARHDARVKAYE